MRKSAKEKGEEYLKDLANDLKSGSNYEFEFNRSSEFNDITIEHFHHRSANN